MMAGCDPGRAVGLPEGGRSLERLLVPEGQATYAADLDGDGRPDNQLEHLVWALFGWYSNVQAAADGAVARGTAGLLLDERAATLTVTPLGQTVALDGAPGDFRAAEVRLLLPLVDGAPALALDFRRLELRYTHDGGDRLVGQIDGLVSVAPLAPSLAELVTRALSEQTDVDVKKLLGEELDDGGDGCATAGDGRVDPCELLASALGRELMAPDIDGALSAGFGFVVR